MSEKTEEVPQECPRIDRCKVRVSKAEFEAICITPSWVHCPYIEEYSRRYKKKPGEWRRT